RTGHRRLGDGKSACGGGGCRRRLPRGAPSLAARGALPGVVALLRVHGAARPWPAHQLRPRRGGHLLRRRDAQPLAAAAARRPAAAGGRRTSSPVAAPALGWQLRRRREGLRGPGRWRSCLVAAVLPEALLDRPG
ncbi:unnamed protein product, partial [Prorocentrum cordatum]